MDVTVTGGIIRRLRTEKGLTQAALAKQIGVTAKAVSKWERAKGLPDLTLLVPLSRALGVSVLELMDGSPIVNHNVSANLLRSKFYQCPVCGNVLHSMGNAVISCCGIPLSPLEIQGPCVDEQGFSIEAVEDEYFVSMPHGMTKDHFISFLAHVTSDRLTLVKLYPEGNCETRLSLQGGGLLYFCCSKHGLFCSRIVQKDGRIEIRD